MNKAACCVNCGRPYDDAKSFRLEHWERYGRVRDRAGACSYPMVLLCVDSCEEIEGSKDRLLEVLATRHGKAMGYRLVGESEQ